RAAPSRTPRRSGSSDGSLLLLPGGTVSRRGWNDPRRAVPGTASPPLRDRLPDPRQRERGGGRGAGDLAALPADADDARVAQGVPVGGRDAGVDRRAAFGAGAPRAVRRQLAAGAPHVGPVRRPGARRRTRGLRL